MSNGEQDPVSLAQLAVSVGLPALVASLVSWLQNRGQQHKTFMASRINDTIQAVEDATDLAIGIWMRGGSGVSQTDVDRLLASTRNVARKIGKVSLPNAKDAGADGVNRSLIAFRQRLTDDKMTDQNRHACVPGSQILAEIELVSEQLVRTIREVAKRTHKIDC